MKLITTQAGIDYRIFGWGGLAVSKGHDYILYYSLLGTSVVTPFSTHTNNLQIVDWSGNYVPPSYLTGVTVSGAVYDTINTTMMTLVSAAVALDGDMFIRFDRYWNRGVDASGNPDYTPQPMTSFGNYNDVSIYPPRTDKSFYFSNTRRPIRQSWLAIEHDPSEGPCLITEREDGNLIWIENEYNVPKKTEWPTGSITVVNAITSAILNDTSAKWVTPRLESRITENGNNPEIGQYVMSSGRTAFFPFSEYTNNFVGTIIFGAEDGFSPNVFLNAFYAGFGTGVLTKSYTAFPLETTVPIGTYFRKVTSYSIYAPRRDMFGAFIQFNPSMGTPEYDGFTTHVSFDLWRTSVTGLTGSLPPETHLAKECGFTTSVFGSIENISAQHMPEGIAVFMTFHHLDPVTYDYVSHEHKKWVHLWGTPVNDWQEYTIFDTNHPIFTAQNSFPQTYDFPRIVSYVDTLTQDTSSFDRLGRHVVFSTDSYVGNIPVQASGRPEGNSFLVSPTVIETFEEYYNVIQAPLSAQTVSFELGDWEFNIERFARLESQTITIAQDIQTSAKNPFFERLDSLNIQFTQALVSAEAARFITLDSQNMCLQQFYPFWKRRNKCAYESNRNDNKSDCP